VDGTDVLQRGNQYAVGGGVEVGVDLEGVAEKGAAGIEAQAQLRNSSTSMHPTCA
jgi:hypothetical protein